MSILNVGRWKETPNLSPFRHVFNVYFRSYSELMKKDIHGGIPGRFFLVISDNMFEKKNTEKTLECDCKMNERVKTREFQ